MHSLLTSERGRGFPTIFLKSVTGLSFGPSREVGKGERVGLSLFLWPVTGVPSRPNESSIVIFELQIDDKL